jgi:hypothetical protein
MSSRQSTIGTVILSREDGEGSQYLGQMNAAGDNSRDSSVRSE